MSRRADLTKMTAEQWKWQAQWSLNKRWKLWNLCHHVKTGSKPVVTHPSQHMDEVLVSSCLYVLNPIKNSCSHQAIKIPKPALSEGWMTQKNPKSHLWHWKLLCPCQQPEIKKAKASFLHRSNGEPLIVPGYCKDNQGEISWMCCHLGWERCQKRQKFLLLLQGVGLLFALFLFV